MLIFGQLKYLSIIIIVIIFVVFLK